MKEIEFPVWSENIPQLRYSLYEIDDRNGNIKCVGSVDTKEEARLWRGKDSSKAWMEIEF